MELGDSRIKLAYIIIRIFKRNPGMVHHSRTTACNFLSFSHLRGKPSLKTELVHVFVSCRNPSFWLELVAPLTVPSVTVHMCTVYTFKVRIQQSYPSLPLPILCPLLLFNPFIPKLWWKVVTKLNGILSI